MIKWLDTCSNDYWAIMSHIGRVVWWYQWLFICPNCLYIYIVYININQTLMNSLQGLLNCEIGGLDCHVITTE